MARHLFIVNPSSEGFALLDSIHSACEGLDYQVIITDYAGHARDLTTEAAQSGGDNRIYILGGDGTLNEAVNGAAAYRLSVRDRWAHPESGAPALSGIALTHIPCGTGNDMIRCFGVKEDFYDIKALLGGPELLLDCIELDTDGQKRFALNICSVGIDADVAAGVIFYKWARRWGSKIPYNLALISSTIKGVKRPYSVTVDEPPDAADDKHLSHKHVPYTILTCCNGQVYGGGFKACPDADPTDGQFEFLLVRGVSRLTLAKIVGDYSNGKYKEMTRYIEHKSGNSMTVEANRPFNINYDGEIIRAKRVTFSLSPFKMRFILPQELYARFVSGHAPGNLNI